MQVTRYLWAYTLCTVQLLIKKDFFFLGNALNFIAAAYAFGVLLSL